MTREEQRQIKAEKKAAKIKEREEKKEYARRIKAWETFEKRMKEKGAWIEEPKEDEQSHY